MLPDYLDGNSTPKNQLMVEAHLKSCEACTQELADLKELYKAFSSEEKIVPPASIKSKFLAALETEKKLQPKVVSFDARPSAKRTLLANNFFRIAASVALILTGFLIGRQQSVKSSDRQIALLKQEKSAIEQTAMISLMENKSASRRIQGVNFIASANEPDAAIVQALADRMLYDENTNVRAAAGEVLAGFPNSESVKNTFIKALKIEKDPGIQITIIRTLGEMQEKKAAAAMRELLDKEETQPFVKDQIESVLPSII